MILAFVDEFSCVHVIHAESVAELNQLIAEWSQSLDNQSTYVDWDNANLYLEPHQGILSPADAAYLTIPQFQLVE